MAVLIFTISGCQSQPQADKNMSHIGGPCEGCEAALEFGDRLLSSTDTLPGFNENEPKLKITGTVFQNDGKTPAKDVILYIYHTNRKGIYEKKGNEEGWGRRHGHFRGWVKTGKDGKYTFFTFRPASYPNSTEPEHIHLTILEHGKNPYYVDDFLFDDDPNLTKAKRARLSNRAGAGIAKPELLKNDFYLIERDLILGLNIPDYD